MSCDIFTKDFVTDANSVSATIDKSWLASLITVGRTDDNHGQWFPLVANYNNSSNTLKEPLGRASLDATKTYDPCDCDDDQIFGLEFSILEPQPEPVLPEDFPYIKYLHQGYISGDISYTNPPLGKEKFVSTTVNIGSSEKTVYIDWTPKETISENPYDAYSSRHPTEYLHNKSYLKSQLISKTCGCFFPLTGTTFPTTEEFSKPYGFSNKTYYNMYASDEVAKTGSQFQTTYRSGIIGWYRYWDDATESVFADGKKIQLYVSDGDVFFDNKNFYISENIYGKFLDFRQRLTVATNYIGQTLNEKAAILSTHPEYDNIVTDLLSNDIDETRNGLGLLETLNKNMTSGTNFGSAFDNNYISDKQTLVKQLNNKYGSYIEATSVDLPSSLNNAYYLSVDFDAYTTNTINYYNQRISQNNTNIVSTTYSSTDKRMTLKYNNSNIAQITGNVILPSIDLVAVHKQGGIHANASPFNILQQTRFVGAPAPQGSVSLTFTPKEGDDDISFRIYSLTAKKLQGPGNTTKDCERFPYSKEQTCKCYGFGTGGTGLPVTEDTTVYSTSSFLPNLSTKFSPTVKLKGGYSQDDLDDYFGKYENDEPVVLAGGVLAQLNNKNDHPSQKECDRQASIDLVNYVNSDYTIDVVNENINTQYLITATEGVQLSASRWIGDPEDEVDNMNWKRFTTKVTINNDKVLYDEKQAIVQNASNSFDIHLTNPFLAKLINDTTNNYYPPHWFPDFWNRPGYSPCDVASRVYSKRGDESSVVRLTFKEYRPKKLFNFWIPSPTKYGTLTRAKFDSNNGLQIGSDTKNPIYYDEYNNNYRPNYFDEITDDNKGILYSFIGEPLRKLCHSIAEFEIDKKIKTYIKIGSNYYSIKNPRRGSYKQNNKTYIGKPKIFEYLRQRSSSQNIPMLFPLPPKYQMTFNFLVNSYDFVGNREFASVDSYPLNVGGHGRVSESNPTQLTFEGTRAYYMVDESPNVYSLYKDTADYEEDPEADPQLEPITEFADIPEAQTIDGSSLPNAAIVAIGEQRFFFKGGSQTDLDNYLNLGKDWKFLVKNYNNLLLDYNKVTAGGYVYDSAKKCDHEIKIYENRKGIISLKTDIKIIKKEIRVQGYDEKNRPSFRNPAYYKIYTVFKLNNPIKPDIFYAADISNGISFCVYKNFDNPDTIGYSNDQDPYVFNAYVDKLHPKFQTKWADVYGMDHESYHELLLDPVTSVPETFPYTVYNNWFYRQVVNNYQSSASFKYYIHGSDSDNWINVTETDPLYCILQKYNLTENAAKLDIRKFNDYQNFIPVLDLTLTNKSIEDFPTRSVVSGLIRSPNWVAEYDEDWSFEGYLNPDSYDRFWINIEEEDSIEQAYVPTAGLYSETLRLDDPYFWLNKTTKTTSSADFKASADTLFPQSSIGTPKKRDYPFAIFNNYDDNDTGGGLQSTSTEEEASAQTISTIIDTLIPGGLPYVTSPLPDPVVTPPASRQDGCSEQDSTTCSLSVNGSTSLYAIFNLKNNLPTYSSVPSTAEYFCTYDAGIYNAFGQKNLIEIYKSELPVDNPLHSAYDFCNTNYLRPDFKRTFHDNEAQIIIEDNIVDTLNDTDKYANEMLFRILYGEKDKINRKMLNSDYEPLTAEDLVNYADPKVKAIDIYDEILYNYDTNADFNDFYINGSFTLNTPVAIGKNFNINIDGKVIDFTIVRNGGAIQADGTIDGDSFLATIYNEYTVATSMAVTDTDVALNDTANTTYEEKATSQSAVGYKYYGWARRIYTGQCIGVYNPWGKDILRHGISLYTCGVIGSNVIYDDVSITNCAGERCQGRANVYLERTTTTDDEATEGDPVAPIAENFSYTFKKCRTNFTLDGFRLAKGAGPCDVSFGYCNIDTEACGGYTPYDYPDAEVTTTPHNRNLIEYWIPYGRRESELRYKDIDGLPIVRGEVWRNQCSSRDCSQALWTSNLAGRHPPRILNPCPSPGYNKAAEEEWENPANLINGRTFPANLTDPCQDADKANNNFETGDPGYDQCGYSYRTNVIPAKKYWLARTTTHNDPWDEEAIVALFTVRYNNREISITIGDVYRCLDASIDDCPSMSVLVPKNGYITESIDSGCDRCSEIPLKLSLSTDNSYQTVKETRRMNIASMAGTDVNPQYLVQTFSGSDGTLDGAGYTNNQTYAICGVEGMMWVSNETDSYGNNARGRPLFISSMTNAFDNINQEVGAQYNIGGSWNTSSVTNAKRICNGSNSKIPEADIISGPVPNSCGELQFETTTRTYTKYRASQDGQTIEESTGTHYTVTAYIEYDYIRPISVYDKVKEILGVTCSVDYNEQDIYPDWYGSVVGVPNIFYTSVPNFVGREPIFFNSCGGSTDCYYKGANDDSCDISYAGDCVDKAPAPCADEDWICWSTNNSAWLKLRY